MFNKNTIAQIKHENRQATLFHSHYNPKFCPNKFIAILPFQGKSTTAARNRRMSDRKGKQCPKHEKYWRNLSITTNGKKRKVKTRSIEKKSKIARSRQTNSSKNIVEGLSLNYTAGKPRVIFELTTKGYRNKIARKNRQH